VLLKRRAVARHLPERQQVSRPGDCYALRNVRHLTNGMSVAAIDGAKRRFKQ